MQTIGIDIGGTGIKAGRIGSEGGVEASRHRPTPATEPPGVMVSLLAELIGELTPSGGGPPSIGIGCAGLVDHERGSVYSSPNLPGWSEAVPLADLVARAVSARPVVLNDANAFVLAEWRLGAGRGASSLVGLTLGTGVGGGIVLGGRLWTGCHGTAGEIGHMPILADGPPCACGGRGCFEALVGTHAILTRYRSHRNPLENPEGESLTPLEIAERARAGEGAAKETWRETGRLLGLGLVGLTHLLDPERFVIGGGVAGAAEFLLPEAEATLREAAMLPARLLPSLSIASLGPDAGWIGAALAARGEGPG